MDVHMVHTLTWKSQGKELVLHIPEGQTNALKADLGITWYRLNKPRKYVIV